MRRPARSSGMPRWPLVCLVLAGCALQSADGPPAWASDRAEGGAARSSVAPPPLDGLDRRVHAEANAARAEAERPTTRWSTRLASVAQAHSEDMARRGYFGHVTPEGVTPRERGVAGGVACRKPLSETEFRVGILENLYQTTRYANVVERRLGSTRTRTAEWFTPDEIARTAVAGWLESPGHRRNLLDRDADAQGVGVAVSPDSLVIVTQVLC